MEAIWDALYGSFWDVTRRWFRRLVRIQGRFPYQYEVRDTLYWDDEWEEYTMRPRGEVNATAQDRDMWDLQIEAEYQNEVWGIAPRL